MGKKGNKAKTQELDDDALLDAAILENKELRAKLPQEVKKTGGAPSKGRRSNLNHNNAPLPELKTLTMQETLAKLDRVMIFSIFRMLPDGSKDICPSSDGVVTFYAGADDVQAELEKLKQAEPSARLGLDHLPLGRAFAISQGLMGVKAPGPTRLLFSRAVVEAEGEAGVPTEMRERMRAAGPFPLFYSEQIQVPTATPLFFAREDVTEYWVAAGLGSRDDAPEPAVTDLRIAVGRTLQEAGVWEPLVYVPAKSSMGLLKQITERVYREKLTQEGFASGSQRMQAVKHAVAVADGEEPPPLSAAADAPPVPVS